MNWTEADLSEYQNRRDKSIKKQKIIAPRGNLRPSFNKYHAKKVTFDGFTFDSRKEAGYYQQLKLRQCNGEIKKIELQPEYVLQDKFTYRGKKYRAIKYLADFRFTDKYGNETVIDVKSPITQKNPVYKLKKKLLLSKYPDINFKEVL